MFDMVRWYVSSIHYTMMAQADYPPASAFGLCAGKRSVTMTLTRRQTHTCLEAFGLEAPAGIAANGLNFL
jgi:hypothetical protein